MTIPSTVLIVDADDDIRSLLAEYIESHGYRTLLAADGIETWAMLHDARPDMILLDLNWPKDEGVTLCRKLRATSTIPVIMLTGNSGLHNRASGLELGANDYLTKPFEPRELLARMHSVLRRHAMPSKASCVRPQRMRFSGWTLDLVERHLRNPAGLVIMLSNAEFRLMRVFLEHPNCVLSRDQLLTLTQRRDNDSFERAIDIQISRLRQKLSGDSQLPKIIETVRNGGYVLVGQVTVESAV